MGLTPEVVHSDAMPFELCSRHLPALLCAQQLSPEATRWQVGDYHIGSNGQVWAISFILDLHKSQMVQAVVFSLVWIEPLLCCNSRIRLFS